MSKSNAVLILVSLVTWLHLIHRTTPLFWGKVFLHFRQRENQLQQTAPFQLSLPKKNLRSVCLMGSSIRGSCPGRSLRRNSSMSRVRWETWQEEEPRGEGSCSPGFWQAPAGSGRLRQAFQGTTPRHGAVAIEKVTSMVLLKLKIVRLHSGDCSRWVSCCADKGL